VAKQIGGTADIGDYARDILEFASVGIGRSIAARAVASAIDRTGG
jgi:hypothetical protein